MQKRPHSAGFVGAFRQVRRSGSAPGFGVAPPESPCVVKPVCNSALALRERRSERISEWDLLPRVLEAAGARREATEAKDRRELAAEHRRT